MTEIDKLWQNPSSSAGDGAVRDALKVPQRLKEAFYAALSLRVDERGILIGAHVPLRLPMVGQHYDDFKLLQEVVELRGGK